MGIKNWLLIGFCFFTFRSDSSSHTRVNSSTYSADVSNLRRPNDLSLHSKKVVAFTLHDIADLLEKNKPANRNTNPPVLVRQDSSLATLVKAVFTTVFSANLPYIFQTLFNTLTKVSGFFTHAAPAIAVAPVASTFAPNFMYTLGVGYFSGVATAEVVFHSAQRLMFTTCESLPTYKLLQHQATVCKEQLLNTTFLYETSENKFKNYNLEFASLQKTLSNAELQLASSLSKAAEYKNYTTTLLNQLDTCKNNLVNTSSALVVSNADVSMANTKIQYLTAQVDKLQNGIVSLDTRNLPTETRNLAAMASYLLPSKCFFGEKVVSLYPDSYKPVGVVACRTTLDVFYEVSFYFSAAAFGWCLGFCSYACGVRKPLVPNYPNYHLTNGS